MREGAIPAGAVVASRMTNWIVGRIVTRDLFEKKKKKKKKKGCQIFLKIKILYGTTSYFNDMSNF